MGIPTCGGNADKAAHISLFLPDPLVASKGVSIMSESTTDLNPNRLTG
jgi:hypothetical protein